MFRPMRSLRATLAAVCVGLAGVAFALTPTQDVLLFGKIRPVWTANFLSPALVASQTLPASLTYTKSGSIPATLFDSTGKLTYQGNNLYINSGSATNTARTISTTAGINYYIWIQTSSGSATVVASGTNSTTFNGSAGGTFTAFTATTGTLTLTPTSNYANITQVVVAQITYESALRTADNVVTGASIYLAPRLDTNPSTLAPAGLLVEEQRVQLLLRSNDITQAAWSLSGGTGSANAATSPDGTTNASSLLEDGSGAGNPHRFSQSVSVTSGTTYTLSAFVKLATASVPYFQLVYGTSQFPANAYVWINMQTGALVSVGGGAVTGNVQSIGNGWYRVWVVATASGTGSNTQFFNPSDNSSSGNYTGGSVNGRANVYFYGGQIEAGSFPTSPIPNPTSSTVTRTADVVQFAGVPLAALQGASGAAIVQTTDFATPVTASAFIGSQTSTNFPAYYFAAGPTIRTYNGTTAIDVSGAPTISSPVRTALAWGSGGRSITYNGRTVASDSGLYVAPSSAWLGVQNSATQYWLNGHFASLALYSQRLPDAKLKSLSVVGAPY